MKYGDVVLDYTNKNQAVFLGTVRLKDIWKYRKRDKVRWWLGTDVLTLWMYPEGKSRWIRKQALKMEVPKDYADCRNCGYFMSLPKYRAMNKYRKIGKGNHETA